MSRSIEVRRGGGVRRDERGIALIMVVIVLMALLLIATPFAVSMRDHRVSAVMNDQAALARGDVDSMTNHVIGMLQRTHAVEDKTPEVDDASEIRVAEDLSSAGTMESVRDPRGRIWSVRVEDEQAKLNVNGASPFALGNLFGGRTILSEKIADDDTDIPVEDPSMFDPDGGYVVLGAELIKYESVSLGSLTGCERGVAAVDEEPVPIVVSESFYFQPGGIVRITDGIRTDYALVSKVAAGRRSIFSGRGGQLEVTSGFTMAQTHQPNTPVIDARAFAINMYRITREPGKCYRYPTPTAIRQITDLGIPGFDPKKLEAVLPHLTVYSNHEGAARWGNHRTIADSFTYRGKDWFGGKTQVEYEVRYPINLNTASGVVLSALLIGLHGERDEEMIEKDLADKLVARILKAREEKALQDVQDFLDRVLQPALDEEEITRNIRSAIFQNFFDSPMITFLKGGTHRGIFNSLDTYTVHANASRNNKAGIELARKRATRVVSVAPPRLLTLGLDSQYDFERNILAGRYSRFVTTYPVNVEFQRFPQDPPVFDPPNRTMKQLQGYQRNQRREDRGVETRDVWASRDTGTSGEDAGSVRYRPARTADGIQALRGGANPTRFGVDHFDNNQDIDGLHLTEGTRTVRMRTGGGRGRGRRGRRGGGGSGLSPFSVGLWYQPRWRDVAGGRHYIFGTGQNSVSDKVELYYDGERKELVLEVADAGINTDLDFSRAYFPINLRAETNYHIACIVSGTRPDQMQILVDGVPYRGGNRQRIRFLTRLVGSLGLNDTSVRVEDTEGFPNRGVLLVGHEKIEYAGKTKNSFRVVTNTNDIVKRGRGARGDSNDTYTHPDGTPVSLFGYACANASDIPAVGGRIAGANATFNRWRPAILESTTPIITLPTSPLGINPTDTTIPLRDGTMEGFQDAGYALIVQWGPPSGITVQGTQTPPRPSQTVVVGGIELIQYSGISGNQLMNVTRGVSTPVLSDTMQGTSIDPTIPRTFVNGLHITHNSATNLAPTWVFPVSLQVSSTQKYLDPTQTNISERVQINTAGTGVSEWVRYDEVLNQGGAGFLARTNVSDLFRLFTLVTGGGQQGAALVPVETMDPWRGPINAAVFQQGMPDPEIISVEEFTTRARNRLQFRGADGTIDMQAGNNTEVIQVFRTERPAPGPEDRVTLVDGTNRAKEQHTVAWSAPARSAYINWQSVARRVNTAHYASFSKNVGRDWNSDTDDIRNGRGGRGRRGRRANIDQTLSSINYDTRQVTRLLKAPSGELPATATGRLVVGGTFGGNFSPCVVDEIETFTFDQRARNGRSTMRRAISTPYTRELFKRQTTQPPQNGWPNTLARFSRVIDANATEIRLIRSDVFYDFDGLTQPRRDRNVFGRGRGGGASYPTFQRRSRDDQDCGCVRIGEEFVIYRGWEEDGASNEVVLRDCIRGAFGTDPQPHEHGEGVLFLSYMEMTYLTGQVSSQDSTIPVQDTLGFAPQGYVAILSAGGTGEVREVIGYTPHPQRGNRQEFIMPQRVDRAHLEELIRQGLDEEGQEPTLDGGGAGIFRGRFGTIPATHQSRSIVLRLPFRYWDRAARNADNPELGYYQFPVNRHGAFFKSVSWGERFPQKAMDIRVLARVDQRTTWDEEPRGTDNGLFEFINPRDDNNQNRIDMQGNLLEMRVFFEYRPGAFDALFNADGWKDTPWLTRMRLDYVQPTQVLYHEERR